MANYKGHVAGGAVAGITYYGIISYVPIERFAEAAGLLYDWQAIFAVIVIATLFGLFPDVDTNSKAQDLFFGIVFPISKIMTLASLDGGGENLGGIDQLLVEKTVQ